MLSLLFAKIVVITSSVFMLSMILYPLNVAGFYFILRPLVQPYAFLQYRIAGNIPLTAVLPVVLILTAFFNTLLRNRYRFLPSNSLPIYLLLFFSILSFLNSMNILHSFGAMIKIFSGIAVYLLVYNGIENVKDAKKVLYALVLSSVIPMLYGYYQYITGTGHLWKQELGYLAGGQRIDSLFGEYNSYGIFLCLTIIAALMLILQENTKNKKMILGGLLVSMVVSSIFALNRGSWISLACGFLFGYVFYFKKLKIRWFIVVSLILAVFLSGMIYQRFQDLKTGNKYTMTNTFKGRIEYIKKSYPLVLMSPLIGHGLGTSEFVSEKYIKIANPPHNDYLRLAIETGIPSVLFYIIFLLREFIANLVLTRKKDNWFINFPMLAVTVYLPIISGAQNIIGNVIIFCMIFALIGVSRKWNEISIRG